MLRLILLASMKAVGVRARTTRRLTFATWLAVGTGMAELAHGRGEDPANDWRASLAALVDVGPAPLPSGDADRDGLPDAMEGELARRYAPIVVLDRRDWNRPASIPWLLARSDFAELFGGAPRSRLLPMKAKRGSDDEKDWTTYVHVYPRADGGVNLQYWFFYPYNDGPGFFDHESDWEHVTVRVDRDGSPLGVYLAHHKEDNPGTYRAWPRMRREGDHPVVLSAAGSHASYATGDDVPWFETAGACKDLTRCEDRVWRTWEGGGLQGLGERARPALPPEVLGYAGPWGAKGVLPGTSAPVSPPHASGFCHAAFERCRVPYQP